MGNPFNKFSYFIDFQIDLIYNSNSFSEYMQFSCQIYKTQYSTNKQKNALNRQNILHFTPRFFALYAMFFALLFIWFNLHTFQILL